MNYRTLFTTVIIAALSLSVNAETTKHHEQAAIAQTTGTPFPYELYKVEFPGTFIRLNTRNGTIDRIRLNTADAEPYITEPLVGAGEEQTGRFQLNYTDTNSTLILIDRIDGRMWRVQIMAKNPENRLVPYNF